jgi:ABC-type Mn2+/Zn2+ transport system permease subunit
VLAAYATGVALNGFLPANIGTFVMLLMFVAIIPGANFPGVFGGMLVQKIFFTLAGAFVYVYLFASVPGTFERQFKLPHDRPVAVVAAAIGVVLLIVVLLRIFRRKLPGLIERAKQGGAILRARASTSCGSSCPRSAPGWPSWA